MIIRNPYSFIAKHYKLINLLLLVPLLYLAFKFGDVAEFFRDYVRANYSTPETSYATEYITGLTFGILVIMLIINGGIYFICTTKKKKILYFLVASIYYVILLFFALFFRVIMENMQMSVLDQTFMNFVRDCANLSVLPIYFLLVVGLTKGVGLNVRTLKFDNNSELIINDDDDEDIELHLGKEENSLKKNIVHIARELKYYILENKFVFTCFAVVFIIVIAVSIFINFQVYNKTYTLNQEFTMEGFTLSLKDSFITNVDYRGNVIADGKYYLAVKLGIINKGRESSMDSSNFRIYLDDESIYPSYDRSARFIDVGKIYQGEIIPNEKDYKGGEFVFVYELTEDQLRNSYQMRILNGLTQRDTKLIKRYKKINIKPTNIVRNEDGGKFKMGTEISFKGTMLGETTYKLNSFEVVSQYKYETENCSGSTCFKASGVLVPSPGNSLVVLNDEIKYDQSTSYYVNSKKAFYDDYVSLAYSFNLHSGINSGDNNYNVSLMKDVTPTNVEGVKIFEVSGTMSTAKEIKMLIRIRNKLFTIEIR